MVAEHLQRGAAVEAAALALLRDAGLDLIARNVRYRQGELDLVMADGPTTVFVEVRYRAHAGFGGAAESVDLHKRRRLLTAARLYLAQHPARAEQPCRFDVVLGHGCPVQLQWLRDAFGADAG